MGYRGKVEAQEQARAMRARDMTLQDIATELGVSKASVSVWVRDVPFTPSKRRTGPHNRPHPLHEAKLAQIVQCDLEGVERIGSLTDAAFLAAGTALYAGEGSKRDGAVRFANSDPAMIRFFCAWFRRFFEVDESRLSARIYLHQGLDIDAATAHWSAVTGIPPEQFWKPYRALPDPSIRRNKHEFGCAYIDYACTKTHRRVMGLVRALLTSGAIPG
jgi:hypothetical protein